jgi:hypothetical protein
MPSGEHETPIALAKLDPDVVAWLLTNVFDIKVPDYHHARAQATDVRVLVPRTYHADGMLLFCDRRDQPLLAVVLECSERRISASDVRGSCMWRSLRRSWTSLPRWWSSAPILGWPSDIAACSSRTG